MNTATPIDEQQAADPLAPPRKAKTWRWPIRIGLAVVVLAIFAFVGRGYRDDLPKLRQAKPLAIVLMVLVFVPTRLLTSEIMRLGLRALGHVVSTYEAFMVSMVNAYANLLIPRAGLGLPALYMKMKHGVPIADFSSVQLVPMTVLQITTIGVAGVAALGVLRVGYDKPWNVPLLIVFGALSLGSVVMMLIPVGVPDRFQNRLAAFLRRMTVAWQRLGRSGHTVSRAMALHGLILVLRAARLQLAFWALGQETNYFGVFIGSLLADLGFFISITPSALGFREGGIFLAAPLIGATRDMCLAAAVLDRIVYSLVIVAIGQVGMWRLVRPVFARAPIAVAADSRPAVTDVN